MDHDIHTYIPLTLGPYHWQWLQERLIINTIVLTSFKLVNGGIQ
jgi:hypothetical protein